MLLVRHASAGDPARWQGADADRPLDGRGQEQAADLVDLLARFAIDRILTSPALRCVETVSPLAAARGLEIERRDDLGIERQSVEGAALVYDLAGADVVLCGHGGLELALPHSPRWRKSAVLVVDAGLNVVEKLRPSRRD